MVQGAAIVLLIYLSLRGACEGMVMTRYTDPMADPEAQDDMDGVRCHRWFRWYHLLCLARDGSLIGVVAAVMAAGVGSLNWRVALGVIFLGWELSELGYNYLRCKTFFKWQENVMGYVTVYGKTVLIIHAVRILEGIALILGGVLWGR